MWYVQRRSKMWEGFGESHVTPKASQSRMTLGYYYYYFAHVAFSPHCWHGKSNVWNQWLTSHLRLSPYATIRNVCLRSETLQRMTFVFSFCVQFSKPRPFSLFSCCIMLRLLFLLKQNSLLWFHFHSIPGRQHFFSPGPRQVWILRAINIFLEMINGLPISQGSWQLCLRNVPSAPFCPCLAYLCDCFSWINWKSLLGYPKTEISVACRVG